VSLYITVRGMYTRGVGEERFGKPPRPAAVPPAAPAASAASAGPPGLPVEEQPTQNFPLVAPSGSMRAAPVAGDRVGKYVIETMLGRGGMGIVVAARHEATGERVAIKLLHPKAAKDAVQVERFVREARSTVRIKSQHVVRVVDAGAEEATGSPFIVMEFLEGRDIGYVLARFGPLPQQKAVDYIIQICEAASAAHALGIVHRDLKPSNFFLTHRPDGSALVKVLDFGISKAAQADGTPDPRLTETQAVFGSPTYMSPEQIRSSKNVDQRSDIWSLGVALFEMITGKLPFVADNVAGLLASVIADAPFTVRTYRPDVPAGLEAIVLACLEKDAARRIGSAGELARRLAPYASPAGAALAMQVQEVASPSASSPNVAPLSRSPSSPSSPSWLPPHPSGLTPSGAPIPFPPPSFGAPIAPAASPSVPAGPPVSFGTTGTDLSSTGPAAFRTSIRRGNARPIAIAAAGCVLVAVLGGIVYVARDSHGSRAAASDEAGPPPSAFTPVPVPVPASTTAAATSAESGAPTASATTATSAAAGATAGVGTGPKIHRPKPGTGHGAPHGSAAGAPDLDSRF